jgi:RHS repeat-associated protein
MKKITLICLLFLVAAVGQAQEITEPGWFNATNYVEAVDAAPESSLGGGSPTLQTNSPSLAEANTAEIQALARGLENDPKRIFDYVHDHIRHVFYFGAKKGAQLTLLEKSGNDFDQCALLVSLLRAAGYSPLYEFGLLQMPYDSQSHDDFDVHHWLALTQVNTNWSTTHTFLSTLLGTRGYPNNAFFTITGDSNTVVFHRVWVKLTLGTTNYYLDPAFKISEPIAGITLASGMGLNTNSFVTAASVGASNTVDYVQHLNEAAVRSNLVAYTTSLLGYIQSNAPNATVEQIMGGQQIVSSANSPLSQIAPNVFTGAGSLPVVDWDNEPTNLMSSFSVTFAGTTNKWFIPALQGQKLTLNFDGSGVAQLWQDDTLILQTNTSGSASKTNVGLSVNHPFGHWDTVNNVLVDEAKSDQSYTTDYQRTNATYVLMYAFEMDPAWLKKRQEKLEWYRQQGFSDTSWQMVSETLNVMGLDWLLQTELSTRMLTAEMGFLGQNHHRLGRAGQEKNNGYYVDMYMQLSGLSSSGGANGPQQLKVVDLSNYFWSALEHGVIEQMQSTNVAAASTIKMLELGNTNGFKTFLATTNNWPSVSTQLTGYDTNDLYISYISQGKNMLLTSTGFQSVAGSGSWGGWGSIAIGYNAQGLRGTEMAIAGTYFGGYSGSKGPTDAEYKIQLIQETADRFHIFSPLLPWMAGGDPVNMADGSFALSTTDLALGEVEPRGLHFIRYYSPTRRLANLAGMANGWVHNYNFSLAETSDPRVSLGMTTPAQMAAMLVATRTAVELYNSQPDAKNWLLNVLIAKWGIDQLIKNAVSVTLGNDTVEFVHQPDGTFTPPAKSTMSLIKTNSHYNLQERHGNTFKFNAAGFLTNIVDQYNQALTMTYNSSNWVQTVKDWKNRQLTFNYTGTPQRLTSITDGTRTVSYGYSTTYSSQGDLASVTDPELKTSTFIYDTNHQIIATLDALGRTVVSNIYDGFGRVVTQYTQGDTNKTWQFYWSGYVNVEKDPAGGRRRFFYDDKSRPVGVQDALGNLNQTFYDGQDHVVTTLSPLNEANQFVFDGNHNLLLTIDPLGFSNQFFYDNQNNLIQSIDARTNSSHFGYNSKFQVIGTTNGAGDWATNFYNATDGTLQTRVDPGGTTTYGYDSYGQLSSVTYPGGLGSVGFLNNSLGDLLSTTNARGFVTTMQYNLRRQLTNTVAATNLTAKIAYDAVGNLQLKTDPRGFATTNFWSATRKPLGTAFPATPQGAPATTNFYDFREWLVQAQNPMHQATLYTNDAAGRLISVIDPLLRTNTFGYDNDGNRLASTNAAAEYTQQRWNSRSELTQVMDPMLKTILRNYDPAGNQIDLTNRNGKRWRFQYDAANRLTNTITALGRTNVLIYNNRGLVKSAIKSSGQTNSLSYDARGRMTNRTDLVGTTTYQYDANNNLTNSFESGQTNQWQFDAYDRLSRYQDARTNVIQYRYDANGNMTNLIYPGNRTVAYLYDSLNRLTNVTDWASRKTVLTYDLASRVTSITRPNGTVRIINYDAAGQTTNIIEKAASGLPISFFKLNWNTAARVKYEFAAPLPHAYTPLTRTLGFDDDNQLATVNSVGVVNDLDGNLTSGPLTNSTFATYAYDARNRLLSAGGLGCGYDPVGNRTSLTNGTNVTRFIVNPNAALPQVLMRIGNGVTNYYIHGAGLLYEVTETGTNTSTATYHYDYRGSTVALTDDSGNVVTDRIEYSSYATMTYRSGNNDTPFLYNGQYGVQTDANGLLYMRARYYNSYLCRFITSDPLCFAGGLNWYTYADGNPISLSDPFGLNGNPVSGFNGPVGPSTGFAPGGALYVGSPPHISPGAWLATGVFAGMVGAGAVAIAAPAAVTGLVALGVPGATATAGVTTTVGIVGAFGAGATAANAVYSGYNGDWNKVAFDVGTLGGGALVGGIGGGRFISDNVSQSPSTVPPSLNPFTADYVSTPTAPNGYGFVRNPALSLGRDLWNLMATGPTPSSGGGSAMGISSGAGVLLGPSSSDSPTGK